jgi:hypothetical protein
LGDPTEARRPAIEVLAEDETTIHLVFDLPALAVETYEVAGATYQTLDIPGGQLHGGVGTPALPAFTRYVAIPARAGVNGEILACEEETLSGYHILPMQDPAGERFAKDEAVYQTDAFLGGESAIVGTPALMRDLRVVALTFQPLRYNPARGEVRVARRIELNLDLTTEDLTNVKEGASVPLTAGFARLYESLVINYGSGGDGIAGDLAPHMGTWLLLTRDNGTLIDRLQPLMDWRRRMGYKVVHATTTETGSTANAIRDWIQIAYDTWPDPPEYITIVGDAGGAFGMPTFYENVSGHWGEGDHPYVQLAGEDLVPDAFIGRLSAETYDSIDLIVNKIVGYERTPFIDDPNWFSGACLVGDPYDSGPTCVQIQQWLKEKLRTIGYTQIDTVFNYPFVSRIRTSVNAGKTYFGYRGFWGMSGWGTGEIFALTNWYKLPFALNLTCGTGSWAGSTSINEAWLRAGNQTYGPSGGIGSVATATDGTHTRYNNCFYSGMAYGLFWEGHYQLGPAQARGKLELISCYGPYEYSQALRYCHWNSLMGDPATEIWTGYPRQLTVTYPASVPQGANLIRISVRDDDLVPVPGAWVYLYGEDSVAIGAYTDLAGLVDIPLDASESGPVAVTVTGHNLHPHLGAFEIEQAGRFVGLHDHSIDDGTEGNGDGQLNPGETVDLLIELKNFGYQVANDVNLEIACDNPQVGLRESGPIAYGDLLPGQTAQAPSPLSFRVADGCPVGEAIQFELLVRSGLESWRSLLTVSVTGPNLIYHAHELGGVGTRLDPGETGLLSITLVNRGSYTAEGPVSATLASEDYAVRIVDPYATYESSIPPLGVASNAGDPFRVTAPQDCVPGRLAHLRVLLAFADGVRDTAHFNLEVGTADSHDPTGPDTYGYLAYDHTDTGYPEAPAYDWININPAYGGPGTSVGLGDFGYDQDDTRTFDLPFPFTYYGETFERVSICSNGWLAMGSTYLVNYRNWHLPSAGGPAYMIAPFWDNLYQSGSGRVYHWFDETHHRYVVAWDNLRNHRGSALENFEVILYDPAHYPTLTGDGVIVFQYATLNDTDTVQMYSTSGIQNGDHTSGITFSYFHQGPPTAANYASGLAIKFTTQAPGEAGVGPQAGGDTGVRLLLGQNRPNPVSTGTGIHFYLARPAPVSLRIHDVDGHLVRTLMAGPLAGGDHRIHWSGCDERGTRVPSGVYFYRLEADGLAAEKKLLVIR